jgi:hypothetical protein
MLIRLPIIFFAMGLPGNASWLRLRSSSRRFSADGSKDINLKARKELPKANARNPKEQNRGISALKAPSAACKAAHKEGLCIDREECGDGRNAATAYLIPALGLPLRAICNIPRH